MSLGVKAFLLRSALFSRYALTSNHSLSRLLICLTIQAANGVSEVYDALEQILSRLHASLSRLEVHTSSPSTLSNKLKEVYVRILACLLEVLGLFTKYLDKKPVWMRASKFTLHSNEITC